jgi:hypothetical protein
MITQNDLRKLVGATAHDPSGDKIGVDAEHVPGERGAGQALGDHLAVGRARRACPWTVADR